MTTSEIVVLAVRTVVWFVCKVFGIKRKDDENE